MELAKSIWESFQQQKCHGETLHIRKRDNIIRVYVREHGSIGGTNYHSYRDIDASTYDELLKLGAIES